MSGPLMLLICLQLVHILLSGKHDMHDLQSMRFASDCALITCAQPSSAGVAALDPWRDPSLNRLDRANALLSRLTLEEKISQLSTSSVAIPRLGIPCMEWRAGKCCAVCFKEQALEGVLECLCPRSWGVRLTCGSDSKYSALCIVTLLVASLA